ncbi:AraC family transcriptional regulator [Mycobacterium colombiense]|uniref:AraC family transcriptional regulator n=1 Tax=Mycobacterium colombiense TaxID=339268 RepID=UPI00200A6F4D|nr:AraC family transcriptional regulator [Mycobacterium colombiense]MCK8646703.1 AraC family transcriptional regulator [Mycobacterium colombiense]
MRSTDLLAATHTSGVLADAATPQGEVQHAADIDLANEMLTRAYAANRLVPTRANARLHMSVWTNDLPGVRLGYTDFHGDVSVVAPPMRTHYVVAIPTRGHVTIGSGGERWVATAERGVIISPSKSLYFEEWGPDVRVLTARISQEALEATLTSLLNESVTQSIEFQPAFDASAHAGGPFLRALQLLHAELNRPDGMTRDPVMAEGFSRLVMAGLLTSQPHNYTDRLFASARPTGTASIRAAVEFIETRCDEITGVAEIAAAASLSVRALEEGFKRHVGVTPMAYVRNVRLARVHEDLKASDPSVTTATAIARRWQFYHYGRFAARYRQRYGVTPLATLGSGSGRQ